MGVSGSGEKTTGSGSSPDFFLSYLYYMMIRICSVLSVLLYHGTYVSMVAQTMMRAYGVKQKCYTVKSIRLHRQNWSYLIIFQDQFSAFKTIWATNVQSWKTKFCLRFYKFFVFLFCSFFLWLESYISLCLQMAFVYTIYCLLSYV